MVQPATMQDVATRVGVHRSTVALALRDHPRIPAATRERIKTVAREMNYQLNPLVAALMRSRRTGHEPRHETIAFVTNYPTRFGWRPRHHDRPDFFPGAARRATELGYRLEHFWMAEPGMSPRRFRDILRTRNIHGLLLGRLPPGLHTLELPWADFSSVALGMTLCSPPLHHVTENHFDTAAAAMHRCAAQGYRRVGFVFSEANDSPRVGARWLGAYLECQRTTSAELLPVCPGEPTDGWKFRRWFRETRPDALLVTHAAPVVRWLESLGRTVPHDVGLVELQDNPDSDTAGMYYDPGKIGALAVEMLAGLLYRNERGVPEHPYQVMLTGEWRPGSTLPARASRASRAPAVHAVAAPEPVPFEPIAPDAPAVATA